MKHKNLLLTTIFLFTAGCSNNNLKSYSKNGKTNYQPIGDIHLVLGDSQNSIGQLYFEIKEKSKLSFLINIDHLPIKKTFNLCPKSGVYRRVKTLFKSFNDGKEHIEYINDKADCESTIVIQKRNNNQVYFDYSIRRLLGYFDTKIFKHDSKMPYTKYYQGRILLNNNQEQHTSKKYKQNGDVSMSIKMKFSFSS
ncbi:MAG: hypothetical protein QM478_11560 [Flavobacteriaceae bacterium]